MATQKPRGAREEVGMSSATPAASGVASSHTRYAVIFVCILALALAARVAMLADFVRSNPVAGMPDGDAAVYWEMAGRIAAGDWIDDKPFLSVPLYPYALAIVRALGGGLTTVYILQLFIHLATGGLLAHLTTQKFGRPAGLMALGVFVLLQEPAFLSTRLLPSTLQLLLVTGTLLAAQRFWIHRTLSDAAVVGVTTGLLALIYPPAMVLVPLLLPWMTLMRAADSDSCGGPRGLKPAARWHRGRSLPCGALAFGMACLTILPATWHNFKACGEFIPITAHAGITFRQGNAPGSDGTYTAIEGVSPARKKMHLDTARVYTSRTQRDGSYGQISRYFLGQGLDYLASDVGRAFSLATRKLYWFLTGRHYSDVYYPSLEQRDGWVNLLFLSPLPTAWLMGPAVVGLIGWGRGRHSNRKQGPHAFHAMDWALLILPILIVMAFWYSPRYRLPALPMLVVASAAAVAGVWHARARASGSVWGVPVALFAASIATGPINSAIGFDRSADVRPHYESNRGHVYAQLGQYDSALERFIKSDRLLPDQPLVLAAMAESYTRLSRFGEAERTCERLLELDPDSVTTWVARGSLHFARGEWSEARDAFERCLRIDLQNPEAHWGMWLTLSKGDRPEEGVRYLEQVVRLDPNHAAAASEYGIWLATHLPTRTREEAGDRQDQAEYYLRRARRLSPDQPEAHFNLGMMLMEARRVEEAGACFRDALRLNPAYLQAQRALDGIARRSAEATRPPGRSTSYGKPPTESIAALQRQIELRPEDASSYSRLAGLLYARGDAEQAAGVLRKAVARAEHTNTVAVELAWLLSTSPDDGVRNGKEAVGLVLEVLGRIPEPAPEYLDVLAAALAETGQFDRANREAQRAATIATQQGHDDLAETIRRRADLYKSHRPFRQLAAGP